MFNNNVLLSRPSLVKKTMSKVKGCTVIMSHNSDVTWPASNSFSLDLDNVFEPEYTDEKI